MSSTWSMPASSAAAAVASDIAFGGEYGVPSGRWCT
jgi:hypothetical protein